MNFLKYFRMVSYAEGISLLLLFFVAMPLKYIYGKPLLVEIVGMAHGLLFIAYILMALIAKQKFNWRMATLIVVWICAVLPFGTFFVDQRFLKG